MRISDWSSDVCSSDLFDEFTRLETIDNGKPLAFSRGDVTLAIDMFRYMAGWTTKITGTTTPLSLGFPHHSYTTREPVGRSEEHTSELQSLMRSSYAVFCLNKKNTQRNHQHTKI